MPYIFPKRRLRDSDILDPVELNDDFTPASDLYSGNLDEHNFETGIDPDVETNVYPTAAGLNTPILSNAYWNIYYAHRRINPGWGTPDNYSNPNSGIGTISVLANAPSWQTIDDMSMTIMTGNSKLWLIAQLQYIWDGWTPEGGHTNSYPPTLAAVFSIAAWGRFPSRVQFALRVDGQIVEGTTTGLDYPEEKMLQPYKTLQERTSGADVASSATPLVTPGPGHDGEENCGALSPECHSLRLGAFHSVSAGTHTIEVVYRRLALTTPDDFQSQYTPSNKFYVANRQLLAVDYPVVPPATAATAVASTPAYESEDIVGQSSLGADRVNVVRAKFNDVTEGALKRGALNNNHLKSQISQKEQATIAPISAVTFKNWYPGFDTETEAPSSSSTGWLLINDGASNNLQIATGGWTIDKTSVILLLGNVEIYRINKIDPNTTVIPSSVNSFCALALGTKVSSTFDVYGPSEMVINRDSNMQPSKDPSGALDPGQLDPVGHDVALMQVLKVGGSTSDSIGTSMSTSGIYYASPTTFDSFGIYGSTMCPPEDPTPVPSAGPANGVNVIAENYRGNIIGIVFQGG